MADCGLDWCNLRWSIFAVVLSDSRIPLNACFIACLTGTILAVTAAKILFSRVVVTEACFRARDALHGGGRGTGHGHGAEAATSAKFRGVCVHNVGSPTEVVLAAAALVVLKPDAVVIRLACCP